MLIRTGLLLAMAGLSALCQSIENFEIILPCRPGTSGCVNQSAKPPSSKPTVPPKHDESRRALDNGFDRLREILVDRSRAGSDSGPGGYGENTRRYDVTYESDRIEREYQRELRKIEAEEGAAAQAALRAERQRNYEASKILKDSENLLKATRPDCAAFRSTYYTDRPPALPAECATDIERMSVYTPGRPFRPDRLPVNEPVIDGSRIPSSIDFSRILDSQPRPANSAGVSLNSSNDTPSRSALDVLLGSIGGAGQAPEHSASAAAPTPVQSGTSSELDATLRQAGNSLVEAIPDRLLKAADPNQKVFADPLSSGISHLLSDGKGKPKFVQGVAGDQLSDALQKLLDDRMVDQQRGKNDPLAQDSLDLSRVQNPANLRKGLNQYPADVLKVVEEKINKIFDPERR